MKKIKLITMGIVITGLLGACGSPSNEAKQTVTTNTEKTDITETTNNSENESVVKEYQDVIKKYNGYDLGDGYKYYIFDAQKNVPDFLEGLKTNFNIGIHNNFSNYKYKIDLDNKISIVPYHFRNSLENESLQISYFLVNNTSEPINSISFNGYPQFKNLTIKDATKVNFTDDLFMQLPPKGVIVFSIDMPAPLEITPKLKENVPADLSIDITDLEINGKKVDNKNDE